jgi:acetyl-CoA synthetase
VRDPGFIWQPPPELVEQANLTRLQRKLGASDYTELHRISIEEPDRFWPVVVDDLGIEFSRRWDSVVDSSRGPEWSTWFNGGRVNVARVCVHRWAGSNEEALVGLYEDGVRESLSWAEMSRQVTQLAESLVELGVREGDRVALYMPMCPAVAVASHACAHIGAVQVPIFSGFAAPALGSRLEDSQAKVVICADWSSRRGKRIEMTETLIEAGTFAVEFVIEWNRETRSWPDAVTRQPGVLPPLEVDSEAPYLLAYTSGTTGRPKGALHVQGGFLVSIARETAYQLDIKRGDRIHFATDMGWIMGPWTVVGGGAVGATIVFAEGAPDWPDDRLWRLVESEQVTMLGLSPTLVRALMPKGEPRANLSTLRTFCTTGEPWNPDPYMWLFDRVGSGRVPIVNISGGTEVGACFLTTVLTEPIKPVALGFPALGQDMDIVDSIGLRVRRTQVGELVCRRPWPGMTRGIWGDDKRYLETYWSRFPGVWTHGDWASMDEDDYWYLHGRSDDTLNIAGKRIGPAELESAAISSGIVAEAAAIGVPHAVKGEAAWIFCVPLGEQQDDELVASAVARMLGKAFKPERVLWVGALPKTRSAKIVRRAVRARVLGKDPGDLSALENPECLEEIARAVVG